MNATNSPVLTPVWAAAPDHDLVVDGTPVAPLWVASTRDERNTGLLGTDGLPEGAVWIERCGNVHTVGMRYPIDVVFLSRGGRVASVATMAPRRVSRPRVLAADVVELAAGRAQALGIRRGVSVTRRELAIPRE